MLQSLLFLVSLIALAIATYTDLRERIVSDKLTYGLIAFGIIVAAIESIQANDAGIIALVLAVTAGTFFCSYLLWKMGVWAGGDVKLFTGIAALNPVNYAAIGAFFGFGKGLLAPIAFPLFPLSLFIFSVFSMLPYSAIISLNGIMKKESLRKIFFSGIKSDLLNVLLLGIAATAIIKGPEFFAAESFPLQEAVFSFIAFLFAAFFFYFVVKLWINSKSALRKEVSVNELQEGMIPAETIVEINGMIEKPEQISLGKIIKLVKDNNLGALNELVQPKGRILADARSAAGLTQEQVDELKGLSAGKKIGETMTVKESAPFVPAVLIAYILLQIVGDILWNVVL
ncbi:MAG: prepilin peptidase [Candidatus Diapherotrites archaeon]